MLIQSSHNHEDRGLDAYFTPPEATISLINIEKDYLPHSIWEPACGNGAIVKPLQAAGYDVIFSDIYDYGFSHCVTLDYLQAGPMPAIEGIVTNPPYKLAAEFIEKALTEVPYLALLLRTNFLESTKRLPLFRKYPITRLWISSRRLPMMHRHGWQGPEAPSNTCFAWFIWDNNISQFMRQKQTLDWFDWADYMPGSRALSLDSEIEI